MREPTLNKVALGEAVRLAADIYRLHEAGLPYEEQMAGCDGTGRHEERRAWGFRQHLLR
jgi:hypothetical protein